MRKIDTLVCRTDPLKLALELGSFVHEIPEQVAINVVQFPLFSQIHESICLLLNKSDSFLLLSCQESFGGGLELLNSFGQLRRGSFVSHVCYDKTEEKLAGLSQSVQILGGQEVKYKILNIDGLICKMAISGFTRLCWLHD
jgi:hypothetical protein